MFKITMPQAGNTMEDGTIVRWVKKEGEGVEKGEVLVEVETDKATIEVESNASGILRKILVPEGTTVPIHTAIAILGAAEEDIGAAVAEAPREAPAPEGAPRKEAPGPLPAGPPAEGVVPILMPQVGNTMEEGTVVKWHVQQGEEIKEGEIIFDVETDKATIEVEAVDSGRLARIVVEEGETIEVKKPVAYIAEKDGDVEAYLSVQGAAPPTAEIRESAPSPAAPVAIPSPATREKVTVREGGRVSASPAARRIARERGVDLGSIGTGTGPGGRILSSDLSEVAPTVQGAPVRRRMSPMRRAIARNLLASKQNIPHYYMRVTIDAEPLYEFYQGEKAKYACTLNDVIVLGCARLVGEMPAFRSRIEKDNIIEYPTANIGIAVAVEDGLVVPVLVGAEKMTLREVASECRRIIEAARSGKVEAMGKGVFTITNLGMFGIEEFSAIINPPEAAILAVGAIREDVIVTGGTVRPGRVMTMTLSADHRIVDGVLGAKFLQRLKELLEQPAQLR